MEQKCISFTSFDVAYAKSLLTDFVSELVGLREFPLSRPDRYYRAYRTYVVGLRIHQLQTALLVPALQHNVILLSLLTEYTSVQLLFSTTTQFFHS